MNKNIKISFNVPTRHIKKIIYSKGVVRDKIAYLKECLREFLVFFLYRNKLSKKRTQTLVKGSYERIFSLSNKEWSDQMTNTNSYLIYKKDFWIANGWLLKNIIVQLLDNCFKQLESKKILEVGSGRGDNIVSLSFKNPSLSLTGLELTKSGLERGKELSNDPQFVVNTVDNSKAIKFLDKDSVSFVRGSGLKMPFIDNYFDTVFTTLVFEQMPYDYQNVLKEIRRVSSKYAIFVEPFYEANDLRGLIHLKRFDYFRFKYSKFKKLGFEPIFFFTDYPQKANQKSGLLVTKIIK